MKRSELAALVLDDEVIIASLFSKFLSREGFSQIDIANDEEAALELINEKKYDFMLLDTFANGPYGPRILKSARESGQNPKVIAMSAGLNFEKEWAETKPDYFLSKPFPLKELGKILEKEFPK